MSNIGLTKRVGKNGQARWRPTYQNDQSAEAHLKDVAHYLESPDRVVGGRDDAELLARCTRDLHKRAVELRVGGKLDLALNFAFGAAVMAGGAPSLRERSLSLYRATHTQLKKSDPQVAGAVLAHHHDGALWAEGVRAGTGVARLVDSRLHTHFRATVHAAPLASVVALPVSRPPVVQSVIPDQRAVA